MYKLVVFIPETHVETVKNAMFAAGAGKIGNYDCCSWQTLGTGQFRPLAGSNAFIGQVDQIEKVQEYRVEMVCSDDKLEASLEALREAHPFETPAFDVLKLATF